MFNKIFYFILAFFSVGTIFAQEVTVDIENSANACGLATDCASDFVCFDILMTVDQNKSLDSYNIWVTYDNTVLSRVINGDDGTCVIGNGGDTDLESSQGAYRVGGTPTSPYPMTANVQETVHTICFEIQNTAGYNGTIISVGGDKFGGALKTTVTFSDASFDDSVAEQFLTVGAGTAPCFNSPPFITEIPQTTPEDTPITFCPTLSDADAGDVLTMSLCSAPVNGSAVLAPGDCVTYTPNPDFAGLDSVCVAVCDDATPSLCDSIMVPITVTPVNDPPVAVDDADTTPEDTPVDIIVTTNDTDSDGNIDPTTVAEVDAPSNGATSVDPVTGVITYTPNPDFNGMDTFTYVVCDDGTPLPAMCDTAEVVVTIDPINDAPLAVDDVDTTPENTPVTVPVTGNDTDTDGNIDPTTVAEVDPPSDGMTSVDPVTGDITYTPDPGFNGMDTFTYVVCDDGTPLPAMCDTAEVVITVDPVNDPPVITEVPQTTPEDTPVTFCPTVSDPDAGDVLTVALCSAPFNGSAVPAPGNCITYTPNPDFNGVDSVCVVVCDNGTPQLCDSTMVPITVDPVNDAPMAVDDMDTTPENTPVTVPVTGNDTDIDGNIDPTTVAEIDPPTDGTTSVDPVTGDITYTPDPGFSGADTFTYVVCDDGTPLPAMCDTAEVIINIGAVNDPPVAVDDADTTPEDTPVDITVTTNDTDTDGNIDPTTVAEITPPSNGTTSVDPVTGVITYTPDPDYNGMDTFTYVVCDDGTPLPAQCDTAEVIVTIDPVNDAPLAVDDMDTTPENTPVTVPVTGNDTDIDGNIDPTTVAEIDPPTDGTTSVDPVTGDITYTPDPGFSGADTFTYVVCDDGTPLPAMCDTAEVIINIGAVNDPPVAVDDADTTPEDTPVDITVTTNDTDTDGNIDPTTVAEVDAPSNGTTSVDPVTGVITYTPDADFNGMDTFTYTVCDDGTPLPAQCDTAEVVVTIDPVNDAPLAVDDMDTTPENTPVTVPVTGNDTDIDGNIDPTTVAEIDPPTDGTTSVDPVTGDITYTPDPGFSGADTFTYVVCDDGTPLPAMCDTAEVVINIGAVNDPPVAVDDADTTPEDTPVDITVSTNDTDTDGNIDPTTVAEVDAPSNGTTSVDPVTGVITYTPDADFNGMDTFTYTVCDDGTPLPAQCDTAEVIVTIDPVNDAPLAVDDIDSTPENTPVTVPVLGNDTDIDGNLDPASVAEVDPPSNGTTSVDPVTGDITYTPDPGFSGPDTFTYVVCDDGTPLPAMCDTAEVIINVGGVNDAPVAVDDADTTPEDTPVDITVTTNDTDTDGNIDPTTVAEVDSPSNGTTSVDPVTGVITYTPDTDFNGMDTFTYVVCDDGTPLPAMCDTAEVIVTIDPVNDAPVAVDDADNTPEDTPVTIPVTGNDTDIDGNVDPTSVAEVDPPSNGTISVDPVTGDITYTPNPDFNGMDTFTYVVCDDGTPLPAMCDTAEVVITIDPVNDAPIAVDDTDITSTDTPVTIPVLGNDTDIDGNLDPASVSEVDPPSNGTTSVDPVTGDITYTPDPGFTGVDTFTYVVCDDGTPLPAMCDTAEVIINVIDNLPPIGVEDNVTTDVDIPIDIVVIDNDADQDGDSIAVTEILTPPLNGTAVLNPDGTITYTPDPGYTGTDFLFYVLCDDGTPVGCDTVLVNITIEAEVIATDDNSTGDVNEDQIIEIIDNDAIPSDSFDIVVSEDPSNGTVVVNDDGSITYTPNDDFFGLDTFEYIVCIGVYCDTANVFISIDEPNAEAYFPNAFSPNGDGENDLFVISEIFDYPDAEIHIHNRWGDEVWNSAGPYMHDWNGSNFNGFNMPDGTYYYVIYLMDADDTVLTGFVEIRR